MIRTNVRGLEGVGRGSGEEQEGFLLWSKLEIEPLTVTLTHQRARHSMEITVSLPLEKKWCDMKTTSLPRRTHFCKVWVSFLQNLK